MRQDHEWEWIQPPDTGRISTGYVAPVPVVKPIKKQPEKTKRKFGFLRILSVIVKIIIGLALTYAVVFSIIGTFAAYKAYKAYKTLINPIKEVDDLAHNNPKETAFMKKCREDLKRREDPKHYRKYLFRLIPSRKT